MPNKTGFSVRCGLRVPNSDMPNSQVFSTRPLRLAPCRQRRTKETYCTHKRDLFAYPQKRPIMHSSPSVSRHREKEREIRVGEFLGLPFHSPSILSPSCRCSEERKRENAIDTHNPAHHCCGGAPHFWQRSQKCMFVRARRMFRRAPARLRVPAGAHMCVRADACAREGAQEGGARPDAGRGRG